MNDSEAKNLLPDYIEGNLSEETRGQIEECLTAFQSCREELAYLKGVSDTHCCQASGCFS